MDGVKIPNILNMIQKDESTAACFQDIIAFVIDKREFIPFHDQAWSLDIPEVRKHFVQLEAVKVFDEYVLRCEGLEVGNEVGESFTVWHFL